MNKNHEYVCFKIKEIIENTCKHMFNCMFV